MMNGCVPERQVIEIKSVLVKLLSVRLGVPDTSRTTKGVQRDWGEIILQVLGDG